MSQEFPHPPGANGANAESFGSETETDEKVAHSEDDYFDRAATDTAAEIEPDARDAGNPAVENPDTSPVEEAGRWEDPLPDATGFSEFAIDDEAEEDWFPEAEPPRSATADRPLRQSPNSLKESIAAVLRSLIQALQGLVDRLESGSSAATALETPLRDAPATSSATLSTLRQQVKRQWRGVVQQVRVRLSDSVNQQVSDRVITAAIVSVAVLLVWFPLFWALRPPKPIQVAVNSSPAAEQPALPAPVQVPIVQPGSPTPAALPTPTASIEQPPREAAPPPESLPSHPPQEAPAPPRAAPAPVKRAPQPPLIARIQDEVSEISNQYAVGLIQSVQANFRGSQLTVMLGEPWYTLSRSQQDSLAEELLRRARQLDFSQLMMVDGDEALLARSPVIGSEMILLQRHRSSPLPPVPAATPEPSVPDGEARSVESDSTAL